MASPSRSLLELVVAARRGDHRAFAELVARHERAALAQAARALGDGVAAEDVVQEAMLDAFLRIEQLREPAAFPGWLRRIVHKHVDRRRRRRREALLADGEVQDAPSALPNAEATRSRAEDQAALRRALDALPEHEREAAALHYLGERPLREVAAALDASEGAIKKRLWSARRRLEERGPETPPAPIASRVALFLAVRSGDVSAVRGLLAREPALRDAAEAFSEDEALAAGTPLAHGLTPLLLAARRGDLPMVDALLAAGAPAEGSCACAAGESPLWAAFRGGHAKVAERLLPLAPELAERPAGAAGWTCHDLARWRGDSRLLSLLGHPPLPSPVRERPWTRERGAPLDTGLKAVDLWAPLRVGDRVRVHGAAETGLMVLVAELSRRIAAAGGLPVWLSFAPSAWQQGELAEVASTHGVDGVVLHAPEGDLEAAAKVLRAHRDSRFVALFVFDREGCRPRVDAAAPALAAEAHLLVRVRPWAAVTQGTLPAPTSGGADVDLVTSPALASEGIWPALDPEASRRRAGDDVEVARARAALTEPADRRRLLGYLTQPFEGAAPDTGLPGCVVPRERTRADVRRLLASRELEPPRFAGALPDDSAP